jgi:hypothetical protein
MTINSTLDNIDTYFVAVDKVLEKTAAPIYITVISIIYFIYITTYIGLSWFQDASEYIFKLDVFLQTLIAIYLILRFHPFRKHEIRSSDATIIFGSGIFLLTNVGLRTYITKVIDDNIHPYIVRTQNFLNGVHGEK